MAITKICNKDKCTGCMVCINVCKFGAIEQGVDGEGFNVPKIINDKCTECGMCIKKCPSNKKVHKNRPEKVYAGWSTDNKIRMNSTSGGVFSEISKYIINNHGVVYGCGMDGENIAKHIRITTNKELSVLRGSKYVQSQTLGVYKSVCEDLKSGKKVLFSGTGCQVAALKNYLEKDYMNLITIDVLCHGVPSPKILSEYLMKKQKEFESTIKNVYFRDKSYGWNDFSMKILFNNGKVYKKITYRDKYIRGFLDEYFLRKCCHTCAYTGVERVSDFTLADYWGYRSQVYEDYDDNKGVSMILINTTKAESILNNLTGIVKFERTLENAVKGNRCLKEPFPMNPNREEFWSEYKNKGYEYIEEKYFKYTKPNTKQIIIRIFKSTKIGKFIWSVKKGYLFKGKKGV